MPEEPIATRSKFLRKNNIKQLKSVNQFTKLFQEDEASDIFPVLSNEDVKALQEFGFPINPAGRFLLIKNFIYDSPPPFRRNNVQNPNVILIFLEVFAARTSSAYADTYPELTPNLHDHL
jgi:hypothetical protein